MRNRLLALAGVVAVAATLATETSAMPVTDAASIKNSAPTQTETVRWRRGWGWGVGAGLLGGAIIGGALASPYYYGPGPYYGYGYGPGPYYGGPGPYGPAPAYYGAPGGDAVAYCMRRYRSYDPRSGTFLGNDGYRHPCP